MRPKLQAFIALRGVNTAVIGDENAVAEAMKKFGIIASPRMETTTAPLPVLGEAERKYFGAVSGRALIATEVELKAYREKHPDAKIESVIKTPADLEPLALEDALDVLKQAKATETGPKEGRDYASRETIDAAKSLTHGGAAALKNSRWAMVRAPKELQVPKGATEVKGGSSG